MVSKLKRVQFKTKTLHALLQCADSQQLDCKMVQLSSIFSDCHACISHPAATHFKCQLSLHYYHHTKILGQLHLPTSRFDTDC